MGTETKYSDVGKPAELLQSELCKVKTYKIHGNQFCPRTV